MNYLSDFELLLLVVSSLALGGLAGLIAALWLQQRAARRPLPAGRMLVRHDVHHHGLPDAGDLPGEEWKREQG